MKDFHPIFNSFQVLLDDTDIWEVVDNEVFSIASMTDKEVCQSIVADVLMVTMWEIQSGEEVSFTIQSLLRNLKTEEFRHRAHELIHDPEISGLFVIQPTGTIRVRKDMAVLQAAMDYAGLWYRGFNMPADAIVILGEPMLEAEIEMVAETLQKELQSHLH